ncbi:3-methyl-2-oxobutanoate hydroxymethyltransferase [Geobacillus subterraneus]|uniref:3-methyl-2-oxobutanoate hydroxymethyltransferase n=2 Tax=Geobacillus TaxID=129337 RepID=A0ABN4NEX7_9BACL|nr:MULTISPECIES: 3-methyl-2-oxobutanoate hydroxymethyltransferase [Geobacillus]AMX83123.1 3-methyl-2-oxobutanoate hydroxymethyltransferase [Geobacillus subterraneus]KZS24357.1 3-methyl-2-oxobutanoate hydroxymethyltransferase [Geobacillus subterraneus]OXB91218.1 3-methyl-2-oxobutanoate hydroxymethyltransferase [Geobacillus uzenensis]QIZ68142.1 3-methyl-2-oxobutanoate hydroxymethyltransferase [Geobacillus subterraneus]WPZ17157.1 3-methyl-2-oxobutanoate hydroxymethyltransferase [Geobacillus subte
MKTKADFFRMKQADEPIVMVTAYDFPSAKLAEQAGVDMILVGDSLGMVVLGYDSTIPVTVDDMIHHTKAVRRGAPNTFIVTDMPFMSYHASKEEALQNARRIMQQSGANAVKVEGADDVVKVIAALTKAGVPVVAHLGLTPQSVGVLGGYKVQGKDAESAKKLLDDAKQCEQAGAMALVLECVPKQLGAAVAQALTIPVIGIGAGAEVDGQVLVYHDLLGYGVSRVPKFVKQYAAVQETIVEALANYVADVRLRQFPEPAYTFTMKEEEWVALYGGNQS